MNKFRVMVFPGAHNLPLWLSDRVDIRYTKSRDEQIGALQNGAVDVIHTSPDNLSLADAAGLVPFVSGTVGPLVIVSTEQLSGSESSDQQKLAVDNAKSGFGRLAYRWLREHLPEVSYEIAPVGGTPQRFEALKSGDATMAVMHPPFTEFCQAAGYTVLGRVDEGYPTLCGVYREAAFSENDVSGYLDAYQEALNRLAGDSGEDIATAVFAREFPDLPAELRKDIARVMRHEVVNAGVAFDKSGLAKLQDLS